MSRADDRNWYIRLGLIVLLAAALRTAFIDRQSYWYDEVVAHDLMGRDVVDLFRGAARDNGNPPLYWFAAKGWAAMFGDGPVAMRSLSALLGVLAVPLLALLGRRLGGPSLGLMSALLLAVSPLEVELSNESRAYAMLLTLVVLNMWLFVRWFQEGGKLELLLYGVTTALGCYTHYYAFLVPPVQGLVVIVCRGHGRWLLCWLGAMAGAALLWLPWLPGFMAQLATPGNVARYADSWLTQFLATPITFALGRSFAWRDAPTWQLAAAAIGTTVAFLVPALLGTMRLRGERLAAVLLLVWLLTPILVPLAVALLGKPIYSHRYATVGLPALLLLTAAGYQWLRPPSRLALGGVLIVLTTISLVRYATIPLKDDWRSATPVVLDAAGPGDLIVFDTGFEVKTFAYYVSLFERTFPADVLGIETTSSEAPLFHGIMYREGLLTDAVPRSHVDTVLSRSRLCLVLCVPTVPPARYLQILAEHGYQLVRTQQFHRIELLVLEKQ